MRTCAAADTIGSEAVRPGDVVYLFLGSATGCPFSRLTSVPFGAGRHFCSGAALTQLMTTAVQNGLSRIQADGSQITPSEEVQGKAAAFLRFAAGP
jgi:cytochrome P450